MSMAPRTPARLAPLVLKTRPAAAASWGILGAALIAAGVYFVVDSHGHPAAWSAMIAFGAIGGFFALQALVPGLVQVRLEPDSIVARAFGYRQRVPWDQIHVARVRRVAGDPFLQLEVREPSPTGDAWRHRLVGVLLPIGCDLPALHRFLAAKLGTGPRAPRSITPLDL